MAELSQFDRLDHSIEALLARRDSLPPAAEPDLAPLVEIAAALREMPREEFRNRLKTELERKTRMTAATVKPIREGFRTVTPYLIVREAPELLEFVKRVFGAQELYRGTGSAGGMHAEVRIGDSILMLGGGGEWRGTPMPTSLLMYVEDADAVYASALRAGAKSISEPADQPYGDREAGVTDVAGNQWYISTHKGARHVREGMHTVNLYLHPPGAGKFIEFLERGFGAEVLERHPAPDGTLLHANVRIGTSRMCMSESIKQYPNMPTAIYMYVPDVDAAYQRAIAAGGESLYSPADQPYGDRSGGVRDACGNHWYISTHIRDVAM
jgi:PhnB protein